MTKTSCGTPVSPGRGHLGEHNRDTCWPCRADAACCVPVRPGESPRKETVQPRGGNTLMWGGGGGPHCCREGIWDIPVFSLGCNIMQCSWSSPAEISDLNFEYFLEVCINLLITAVAWGENVQKQQQLLKQNNMLDTIISVPQGGWRRNLPKSSQHRLYNNISLKHFWSPVTENYDKT